MPTKDENNRIIIKLSELAAREKESPVPLPGVSVTKDADNRIRVDIGDAGKKSILEKSPEHLVKVLRGEPGAPGKDGADGRSIKAVEQLPDGRLKMTFSDGEDAVFLLPRGQDGASITGKRGPKGNPGKAGTAGKGIQSISMPEEGVMRITLTDGTTVDFDLPRGRDAREIQLRATATHLQWRYEGEEKWRNLLRLDLLRAIGLEEAGSLRIKLGMLVDVDTSTQQDGYVLSYDEASNTYIFVPPGGGGGGTTWFDGSGAPGSGLGVDGDYYLDVVTGDVYKKVSGVWGVVGNIQGPAGATGATGAPGAPGSVWYDGSGAPAGGLGIDGDYYLDTDNGDVYFKASGSWSIVGNIQGPAGAPGAPGAPGSVWYNGSGPPAGGLGVDGDYYLDNANGDVYFKTGGVWGVVGNITGPTGATGATGAAGAPGSVWYNGSGPPAGGLGIVGDYYLDNSNGDVYWKTGFGWGVVANIEGPQGPQGDPGLETLQTTNFVDADGGIVATSPGIWIFTITNSTPREAFLPTTPLNGEWFILANNSDYRLGLDDGGSGDSAVSVFDGSDLLSDGISPHASYLAIYDSSNTVWNFTPMGQPHRYIGNHYRDIVSNRNAGSPNTLIDTTIKAIVVVNGDGDQILLENVTYTVNTGASGAGGVDTGSIAAGSWYYQWIIAQPDGTYAGLISLSDTAPTMPSGYTYKALVGPFRTLSPTPNIISFQQYDNRYFWGTHPRILASGAATTETAVSVATGIPPIATDFDMVGNSTITATAGGLVEATLDFRVVTGVSFSLVGSKLSDLTASQTLVRVHDGMLGNFPNFGNQFLYLWTVTNGSAQVATVFITGFRFRI